VCPYPYEPTGLFSSCNNYKNLTGAGGLVRGCKYKYKYKYKNKKFNSYFAGLFEGAGLIWLPNTNWKKKHNPRFCITFALKKEPLAKKILEILEYGHIKYKPKENARVLSVSPVKGLKKII
jgi:hypothetical protein